MPKPVKCITDASPKVPFAYLPIKLESDLAIQVFQYVRRETGCDPVSFFYQSTENRFGVGLPSHVKFLQLVLEQFVWKGKKYSWVAESKSTFYRLLIIPTKPDNFDKVEEILAEHFVIHAQPVPLKYKSTLLLAYQCIAELPADMEFPSNLQDDGVCIASVYDLRTYKFCFNCFQVVGKTCICDAPV